MLEIVLWILKAAGVIFASVLGILIVLIGIALFVPVRYRGEFSMPEKKGGEERTAAVRFKAAWLLHLVRIYAVYENAPRVRLKVLFFTLMDTAQEKGAKRKGKKAKQKKDGEDSGEAKQDTEEIETDGQGVESSQERTSEAPDEKPGSGGETKEAAKENAAGTSDRENAGRKDSSEKEKKTIKTGISNILQTIRSFCDKLKSIKEKAERIENLWTSDHMTNSRVLFGRQLRYLLKHSKPKKLSGYLRFGFDDPSTTGYAMAVYGILYAVWSPELSVEPDFEKQVLESHILLKGKIRVWHFVRVALRMFLSRDVRRVIKDVRKL